MTESCCALIKLVVSWNFPATLLRCLMPCLAKGSKKFTPFFTGHPGTRAMIMDSLSWKGAALSRAHGSDPVSPPPPPPRRPSLLKAKRPIPPATGVSAVASSQLIPSPESVKETCLTQSLTLLPGTDHTQRLANWGTNTRDSLSRRFEE